MEILTFLDGIHKLDHEARINLMEITREKSYRKNEVVQEIGSSCRTIYIVKTGGARIFYYKDGIDVTEHFAFEGDIIVRAESLFTGKATSKGIQTIDESTIYGVDSERLFKLYDKHHDLERLFRLIFEKEYVQTVKRIESLQFKSAKERYLELMETTDFVQKIPLKYIASYLGITQVSLSRIRGDLS